jgi:Leucine-rich repeat (LRR) protein
LRRLTELDCSKNLLSEIDLAGNASLQRLDCRDNAFSMLDLSPCSVLLKADVRSNPHLSTVYYRAGQQVNYEAPTVLIAR